MGIASPQTLTKLNSCSWLHQHNPDSQQWELQYPKYFCSNPVVLSTTWQVVWKNSAYFRCWANPFYKWRCSKISYGSYRQHRLLARGDDTSPPYTIYYGEASHGLAPICVLLKARYDKVSIWTYCWWKKSGEPVVVVVFPDIYKVLYIPGGAGFLPSTVVWWLQVLNRAQIDIAWPTAAWQSCDDSQTAPRCAPALQLFVLHAFELMLETTSSVSVCNSLGTLWKQQFVENITNNKWQNTIEMMN